MENKNEFEIFNDKGEKITCNALFTFESDETGKNYIVYTDNTTDEEGNKKVYASTFDPKEENPVLGPIETDEEWKVIENILNKLQEGTKSELWKKYQILVLFLVDWKNFTFLRKKCIIKHEDERVLWKS